MYKIYLILNKLMFDTVALNSACVTFSVLITKFGPDLKVVLESSHIFNDASSLPVEVYFLTISSESQDTWHRITSIVVANPILSTCGPNSFIEFFFSIF